MRELDFDSVVNKLILLYAIEKMDFPLSENSILDICTSRNTWLSYMECKDCMWQLEAAKFIFKSGEDDASGCRYVITYDGRSCLSHYFQRIPSALREEITDYAKNNRAMFKRNQEYTADYKKNEDGTFTILFKINDPSASQALLEVKVIAQTRVQAVEACKRWRSSAPGTYEFILEKFLN